MVSLIFLYVFFENFIFQIVGNLPNLIRFTANGNNIKDMKSLADEEKWKNLKVK